MNSMNLVLKKFIGNDTFCTDEINFKNCAVIHLIIDEQPYDTVLGLDGTLLVWEELRKTSQNHRNGMYLLFTCACGIAEDAGCEGVFVRYKDDLVSWLFKANDEYISWDFNLSDYLNQITKIQTEINVLDKNIKIEPTEVIYPSLWINEKNKIQLELMEYFKNDCDEK